MPSVQCQNCGLVVQVPAGGRRLCGCGSWLSCDDVVEGTARGDSSSPAGSEPVRLEDSPRGVGDAWPRIEGDMSAIERLNDGFRRITSEINKAIVGQQRVIEELLIAVFARGHCLL